MCQTGIVYGDELAKYSFGTSHPFNSFRLYAFWSKLVEMNLDTSDKITIEKPKLAEETDIELFHCKKYIDLVKEYSIKPVGFLDHGDTPSFKGVFEASCYVVGSTLKALDLIMEKDHKIMHLFNPIGGLHHARKDTAGGFCVFNDIGIVITMARKRYDIERICYVDIDAHHGDGVYYEFERDRHIFIADIHEDSHYLYPGTGDESETGYGDAIGTKLNIQLKPQSGDNEFIDAFKRVEEFIETIAKPQLIILQCGTDGIKGDPLTHLQYSPNAHRYAADKLHYLAHKYCNGKIIALGGGGYNQENIAEGWTRVIKSFVSNSY